MLLSQFPGIINNYMPFGAVQELRVMGAVATHILIMAMPLKMCSYQLVSNAHSEVKKTYFPTVSLKSEQQSGSFVCERVREANARHIREDRK